MTEIPNTNNNTTPADPETEDNYEGKEAVLALSTAADVVLDTCRDCMNHQGEKKIPKVYEYKEVFTEGGTTVREAEFSNGTSMLTLRRDSTLSAPWDAKYTLETSFPSGGGARYVETWATDDITVKRAKYYLGKENGQETLEPTAIQRKADFLSKDAGTLQARLEAEQSKKPAQPSRLRRMLGRSANK